MTFILNIYFNLVIVNDPHRKPLKKESAMRLKYISIIYPKLFHYLVILSVHLAVSSSFSSLIKMLLEIQ